MVTAAKDMDFLLAAKLRDEMFALEKMMEERFWCANVRITDVQMSNS